MWVAFTTLCWHQVSGARPFSDEDKYLAADRNDIDPTATEEREHGSDVEAETREPDPAVTRDHSEHWARRTDGAPSVGAFKEFSQMHGPILDSVVHNIATATQNMQEKAHDTFHKLKAYKQAIQKLHVPLEALSEDAQKFHDSFEAEWLEDSESLMAPFAELEDPRAERLFHKYDTDRSGVLDRDEIVNVVHEGLDRHDVSAAKITELMHRADKFDMHQVGHTRGLNLAEFKEFLMLLPAQGSGRAAAAKGRGEVDKDREREFEEREDEERQDEQRERHLAKHNATTQARPHDDAIAEHIVRDDDASDHESSTTTTEANPHDDVISDHIVMDGEPSGHEHSTNNNEAGRESATMGSKGNHEHIVSGDDFGRHGVTLESDYESEATEGEQTRALPVIADWLVDHCDIDAHDAANFAVVFNNMGMETPDEMAAKLTQHNMPAEIKAHPHAAASILKQTRLLSHHPKHVKFHTTTFEETTTEETADEESTTTEATTIELTTTVEVAVQRIIHEETTTAEATTTEATTTAQVTIQDTTQEKATTGEQGDVISDMMKYEATTSEATTTAQVTIQETTQENATTGEQGDVISDMMKSEELHGGEAANDTTADEHGPSIENGTHANRAFLPGSVQEEHRTRIKDWLVHNVSIDGELAENYSRALVSVGADSPKDLVGLDVTTAPQELRDNVDTLTQITEAAKRDFDDNEAIDSFIALAEHL